MRTISLVELQRDPHHDGAELSRDAGVPLPALASAVSELVEVRSTLDAGRVSLITGTRVGTITVGALRIDVRPRLAAADLVALIRYAQRAPNVDERSHVATDRDVGIDELVGRLLAEELDAIRQRGVARQYVDRRDRMTAVRGRVDFLASFPWDDHAGRSSLACRYHELSCDNLDNRLIAAALGDIGGLDLSPATRARLAAHRHAWRTFVVGQPTIATDDFARARTRYTRLTDHYRLAHHLCETIVARRRARSLFDHGAHAMAGLTLAMPPLFEAAVARLLGDAFAPLGLRVDEQAVDRGALCDAAGETYRHVRPDVIVYRDATPVAVIDAKYKDYWPARLDDDSPERKVDNADVYQSFFYAARLQATHRLAAPPPAILIAPAPSADAERGGRRTIADRFRTISLRAGGGGVPAHRLTLAFLPLATIARERGRGPASAAFVQTVLDAIGPAAV